MFSKTLTKSLALTVYFSCCFSRLLLCVSLYASNLETPCILALLVPVLS